jgi:hypothetical protein
MATNQELRAEIREFLVSRRARITPEQAGLRAFGTSRRVKGLRREEVATLAGVSAEYCTRVERGNVTESLTPCGSTRRSASTSTTW